jgi:hypothetical protein
MRKTLSAAAIALAMLAGCSHAGGSKDVAGTPTAASPSLPPMFVPPPGGSGDPAGGAANGGTTTGGTTTGAGSTVPGRTPGTASPTLPGDLTPRIEALRTTWITATVSRTGPGSCIGLTSTDGTAYAVYLTQSARLTTGMRVRARISPGKTAVDCGAGRAARSDRVQIAG